MAQRRYLFALDSSNPMLWVDRYLGMASLKERTSGLVAARDLATQRAGEGTRQRTDAAGSWFDGTQLGVLEPMTPTGPGRNASVIQLATEQLALTQRLARTNLFAPAMWAVGSASAIQADATNVSPSFRTFFAAPHANTDQFVHCADRESALAALERARAVTPQQMATMEPGAQTAAIGAMYQSFWAYFDALNVNQDSWARWRSAVERTYGACPGNDAGNANVSLSTFLVNPLTALRPEGYDLLFAARPDHGPPATPEAIATVERLLTVQPQIVSLAEIQEANPPSLLGIMPRDEALYVGPISEGDTNPLRHTWAVAGYVGKVYRQAVPVPQSPTWLMMTMSRARQYYPPIHGPRRYYFGSLGDCEFVRVTQARFRSLSVNDITMPTPRFACEGATLRHWPAPGPYGGLADPAAFDHLDCVLRSGKDGEAVSLASFEAEQRMVARARLLNEPMPALAGLLAPRPGFNWMCGAISAYNADIYYRPPLLWFVQLLWPILDYLATRDPLEVIFEVQLDVLGKNLWTTIATGRGSATLAGLGTSRALADAGQLSSAMRDFSMVGGAVATGIGLVSPVFGALAGFIIGGINLLSEAMTSTPRPTRDCFGRVEPTIDYLALRPGTRQWMCPEEDRTAPITFRLHGAPGSVSPTLSYGLTAQPDAPAFFANTSVFAPSTQTALATAPRIGWIRLVGMPEWSEVFTDGEFVDGNDPTQGRWEDATKRVYLVSATVGSHVLRVVPPATVGAPWEALVTVPAAGVTVTYGAAPVVIAPIVPLAPAPTQPPVMSPLKPETSAAPYVAVVVVLLAAAGGGALLWNSRQKKRKANDRRRAKARRNAR